MEHIPYSNYSDDQLITLLKKSDEKALSELYLRYWEKLLVVAGNRLDNLSEAEEAVQDVFYSLWKRRDSLVLKYTLATYLAVAVKYRVFKAFNRKYRLKNKIDTGIDLDLQIITPSADADMLERELLEQLAVAVAKLPEKCRIVFTMSREEGLNNKKIAEQLNISEKTVEAHLTKALKDIKKNLSIISPALVWLLDKL